MKHSHIETINEVAALLLTLGKWQTKCDRTNRDDNLALTLNSNGMRLKQLVEELEVDMRVTNLALRKEGHN